VRKLSFCLRIPRLYQTGLGTVRSGLRTVGGSKFRLEPRAQCGLAALGERGAEKGRYPLMRSLEKENPLSASAVKNAQAKATTTSSGFGYPGLTLFNQRAAGPQAVISLPWSFFAPVSVFFFSPTQRGGIQPSLLATRKPKERRSVSLAYYVSHAPELPRSSFSSSALPVASIR